MESCGFHQVSQHLKLGILWYSKLYKRVPLVTPSYPIYPVVTPCYPNRKAHRVTPGQTAVTPGVKSQWHSGSDAPCFEVVAKFESCPWVAFSYARNQNMEWKRRWRWRMKRMIINVAEEEVGEDNVAEECRRLGGG